ncbi:hypothetical protein K456DRAFT_55123 [Colletotrichum gloeosporioides 23]|nr:hypothetical protein K456DRAFT_55123 [Colletotrichum gloeosporioides 23]
MGNCRDIHGSLLVLLASLESVVFCYLRIICDMVRRPCARIDREKLEVTWDGTSTVAIVYWGRLHCEVS